MTQESEPARRLRWKVAVALALMGPLGLAACGVGTLAILGASGSDSDAPTSSAPVLSNLRIEPSRLSPATVAFSLKDLEGNPADVSLVYVDPATGATHALQLVADPALGIDANLSGLVATPSGAPYAKLWDFASQLGAGYREALVVGAETKAVDALGDSVVLIVNVGNDAPTIPDLVPPAPPGGEASGLVLLDFSVADSSDDPISITAEYDVVGDSPDAGFVRLRPATTPSSDPPPTFALTDVVAPRSGTRLTIFWNVVADLGTTEADVVVRLTPTDGVVSSPGVTTAAFHVDNNGAPIAFLKGAALLADPDTRGTLPIPFSVEDPEGDALDVVVQWTPGSSTFPPLPTDAAALRAALADPAQRRALKLASERPASLRGRIGSVPAADVVRLGELAGPAAGLLAGAGVVGRELDLLRASRTPAPIAATWPSNPLHAPVAALPAGAGERAFVLQSPLATSHELLEIELATGAIVASLLVAAAGDPDALAFDADQRRLLVASHVGSDWQITRVDPATGAVEPIVALNHAPGGGPVRGLVALDPDTRLLTLPAGLVRVRGAGAAAVVSLVQDDLQAPFGLALDPLDRDALFVAERDWIDPLTALVTGRVTRLDLRTGWRSGVVARNFPFVRPTALALDAAAARMVVVTDAGFDGSHELREVDLGGANAGAGRELAVGLGGAPGAVATGPEGLRLVALAASDELVAGGGIVQRRTIVAYAPAALAVTVGAPFAPAAVAGDEWRIEQLGSRVQATPAGVDALFLWDGRDLPEGGDVLVRVVPLDAEIGNGQSLETARPMTPPLAATAIVLGGAGVTDGPAAVATADLDGDGDLDVAVADSVGNDVALFFQSAPGQFAAPVLVGQGQLLGAAALASGDFDGDGDLDLAVADRDGDDVRLLVQDAPGTFFLGAALGSPIDTDGPAGLLAADLDGDGDLDLAVANEVGGDVRWFRQGAGGAFTLDATRLGGPATTAGARGLVAADLDADGDVDLAVAAATGDKIALFLATAPGSFPTNPSLSIGSGVLDGPVALVAADLDGDGDLDLATANRDGGDVGIVLQSSPGAFAPPQLLGQFFVVQQPEALLANDVDGDGDVDLLVALAGATNFPAIALYVQHAPGDFGSGGARNPDGFLGDASLTSAPNALAGGDLDGDGRFDLVAASAAADHVAVVLQAMPARFSLAPDTTLSFDHIPGAPTAVVAADLDQDGDLDLATTLANSPIGSFVTVHFQKSPGVFPADQDLVLGDPIATPSPQSLVAGDFDGDGALDLACANAVGNSIAIFLQKPGQDPRFDSAPDQLLGSLNDTPGAIALAAADVDGDGRCDLACANFVAAGSFGGSNLVLFLQRATGGFATTPDRRLGGTTQGTRAPRGIVLADLNRDGRIDVASANQSGDSLALFFQSASGSFAAAPDLVLTNGASMKQPQALVAADLDGDGIADLACANQSSKNLTCFRQDPAHPGAFLAPVTLGGGSATDTPRSLAVADLDGDGFVDLIAGDAKAGAGNLALFFRRSDGTFATQPDRLLADGAGDAVTAVVAADLDGDGEVDLVGALADPANVPPGDALMLFFGGGR